MIGYDLLSQNIDPSFEPACYRQFRILSHQRISVSEKFVIRTFVLIRISYPTIISFNQPHLSLSRNNPRFDILRWIALQFASTNRWPMMRPRSGNNRGSSTLRQGFHLKQPSIG